MLVGIVQWVITDAVLAIGGGEPLVGKIDRRGNGLVARNAVDDAAHAALETSVLERPAAKDKVRIAAGFKTRFNRRGILRFEHFADFAGSARHVEDHVHALAIIGEMPGVERATEFVSNLLVVGSDDDER